MLKNELLEFLEITGMNQSEFAIRARVCPASLNSWIKRDRNLCDDNYKRIEDCLLEQKMKLGEYLLKMSNR